ncbi:MAG: outer membrane protein transport protein [Pirellulaceae bacterium]
MSRFATRVFVCGCLVLACCSLSNGQGILFPWTGPVSRAMGGATTAAPVDAVSTTFLNPAAMADTQSNELGFGVDLIFPQVSTSSSITGLGAGSTDGEPGVIPLPNVGWIFHSQNCNIIYGLSVASVGGAKTNYPSSATNPFFTPQSNNPLFPGGLGRVDTSAQFLQIMPSVCLRLTERFSIGIAPTITLGQLVIDPFVFAAPDDADGSGAARYPIGSGAHMNWGGGFQVSSYFKASPTVSFGATYRSKQWMQTFDNLSVNELGLPREVNANFDLPTLLSIGTAYSGFQNTVLSFDARYVRNSNADGWGGSGFNPDGSLVGLGYSDQYMLGGGLRRRLTQRFTAAGGYTFCSSLLANNEATIGVLAPLHYQHVYSMGGTIHLGEQTNLNFAYSYSPENELSGPIVTPFGPVPGSNVTTQLAVHAASLGVAVRY